MKKICHPTLSISNSSQKQKSFLNSTLRSFRGMGFTIVELLVAISIVVILLLIIMVGIGGVKDRANLSKSVSNLREIHAAISLYVINNNNEYPRVRTHIPEGGEGSDWDYEGGFWFNSIGEYLAEGRRFRQDLVVTGPWPQNIPFACPSIEKEKHGWGGAGIDVGLNGYLFPAGSPPSPRVRASSIENPSQALLVGDAKSPAGFGAWMIHDPSPMAVNTFDFRHQGKANILFVDGRVAQITPEQIQDANLVRRLRGR